MKHTILILSLFFALSMQAQEPVVTWEGLVKQKAKSDESILNPKKSGKASTWAKRAKLYYDISEFNNVSPSFVGLPGKGAVQSVEFLVGKPNSVETTADGEVWVYDHKKLYMKDGRLDRWEETDFIDKDALAKSGEAYLKAAEIDPGYMEKSMIRTEVMFVRNALVNEGVNKYQAEENKVAYDLILSASKLSLLPRDEKIDTSFEAYMPTYYAGVVASEMKNYDAAAKHFETCIAKNYNGDNSYHSLANIYLEQGDSTAFINKVQEGFDKYPDSEQLVIDMINYYMSKDEPDKVIQYIDLAITKNPENASFYSAKASIYDNRNTDMNDKYKEEREAYYTAKKEAFRVRFEPEKKAEAEKKMVDVEAAAVKYKAEGESNFNKAEALYKESIAKNKEFYNPYFNLGRLHYKTYELMMYESEYAFKVLKDESAEKSFKDKGEQALKRSADYFEQAHQINPKDRNTIELLRSIYFKLRDYDKANMYKEMLSNMKSEETENGIK